MGGEGRNTNVLSVELDGVADKLAEDDDAVVWQLVVEDHLVELCAQDGLHRVRAVRQHETVAVHLVVTRDLAHAAHLHHGQADVAAAENRLDGVGGQRGHGSHSAAHNLRLKIKGVGTEVVVLLVAPHAPQRGGIKERGKNKIIVGRATCARLANHRLATWMGLFR